MCTVFLPFNTMARHGSCSIKLTAPLSKTSAWRITPTPRWRTGAWRGRLSTTSGEFWLLSRVYSVLGDAELALLYARRTLELTEEHLEELEKFDQAFAFECMARAHALTGNVIEAKLYLKSAQQAGEEIPEKEDRDMFFAELKGGEWNNIRG